jgi:hypothetical protein
MTDQERRYSTLLQLHKDALTQRDLLQAKRLKFVLRNNEEGDGARETFDSDLAANSTLIDELDSMLSQLALQTAADNKRRELQKGLENFFQNPTTPDSSFSLPVPPLEKAVGQKFDRIRSMPSLSYSPGMTSQSLQTHLTTLRNRRMAVVHPQPYSKDLLSTIGDDSMFEVFRAWINASNNLEDPNFQETDATITQAFSDSLTLASLHYYRKTQDFRSFQGNFLRLLHQLKLKPDHILVMPLLRATLEQPLRDFLPVTMTCGEAALDLLLQRTDADTQSRRFQQPLPQPKPEREPRTGGYGKPRTQPAPTKTTNSPDSSAHKGITPAEFNTLMQGDPNSYPIWPTSGSPYCGKGGCGGLGHYPKDCRTTNKSYDGSTLKTTAVYKKYKDDPESFFTNKKRSRQIRSSPELPPPVAPSGSQTNDDHDSDSD